MTLEQLKTGIEVLYDIDLSLKSRKRDLVYKRFVYFYLARVLTTRSLKKIAETVNSSHCNVIFGAREVEQSGKYNRVLKGVYDEIVEKLNIANDINVIITHDLVKISQAEYVAKITEMEAKYRRLQSRFYNMRKSRNRVVNAYFRDDLSYVNKVKAALK